MKKLNDLTKREKIDFLRLIQAGKINPKKHQEPFFLTNKTDVWVYIANANQVDAIPITQEARETLEKIQRIANQQN